MNITDVAREAGVSIATVSRVVNNNDYPVRPETRERVLDAVRRLGFRPNDLARGLLQKRTRTVGLIVPDLANPYYPEIARGVEDAASAELYAVVFCNTDRRADKSEHYVDTLLQKRVDGIIIAGGGTDFTHASTAFAEFGAPVVFIGRHRAGGHSVQIDNVAAARGATAHLAALGHREIAFVTGPLTLTSVQDRLAGYRAGLEAAGLGWDDRLVREGDFGERSGYTATQELLKHKPTAIFAANDLMGAGVLDRLEDDGVRVPQDVSIVGFDNTFLAALHHISLTTINQPRREMGRLALELLLERLDGRTAPVRRLTEPSLVVRDTTGPPR
jgi:DNA-binding LacI/PurR family transcriptional regulator